MLYSVADRTSDVEEQLSHDATPLHSVNALGQVTPAYRYRSAAVPVLPPKPVSAPRAMTGFDILTPESYMPLQKISQVGYMPGNLSGVDFSFASIWNPIKNLANKVKIGDVASTGVNVLQSVSPKAVEKVAGSSMFSSVTNFLSRGKGFSSFATTGALLGKEIFGEVSYRKPAPPAPPIPLRVVQATTVSATTPAGPQTNPQNYVPSYGSGGQGSYGAGESGESSGPAPTNYMPWILGGGAVLGVAYFMTKKGRR